MIYQLKYKLYGLFPRLNDKSGRPDKLILKGVHSKIAVQSFFGVQ